MSLLFANCSNSSSLLGAVMLLILTCETFKRFWTGVTSAEKDKPLLKRCVARDLSFDTAGSAGMADCIRVILTDALTLFSLFDAVSLQK